MPPFFRILATLLLTSFGWHHTYGQGLTLLDDFNRANSPTVSNGWTEVETSSPSSVAITGNQLRLSSATAGRDYVVRDVSSRYSPVLSTNSGRLSWAWNTQQSRPNPSGFDNSNYGNAFVLAASSADLTATTTSGYAVVVGNSGTPDPIRLVRFSGGLTRNSNLVNVFSTSTDYGTKALTLRVTYFPGDDSWTLEASTNTTSFEDPASATSFVTLGTGTDATYTSQSLPYVGCLWNHATTGTENTVFDNIYLTAPCATQPKPTTGPTAGVADQLTSTTARLSLTAGNGTTRLVILRAGSAPGTVPADGAAYAASAAFGSSPALAAGEYAVYAGSGTSVDLTGLQPNTSYPYAAYEANGTGCAANYLQASPLTGTFTTLPCSAAAPPAVAASGAAAAPATGGSALTFSWQNGDGAARLVVVRRGQAVAATPLDGTSYGANARYGAGAALSSDEYVVYAGSGSSVTVSGLTAGQTYYAAVYEYNGSGCTTSYLVAGVAQASGVAPAPPVSSAAYRFFRGNLHGHSSYSDGNKDAATSGAATPADDYALARLARQMDFMGISEHNHAQAGMSLPNYAKGLLQADQANQDGTFVTLYGMEWGTISGGGHVIIYGYEQLIGWEASNYDVFVAKGDYTGLFATLAQRPGAVAYLAHPQATDYNNLLTAPLNPTTAQVLVGSAVRSGSAFSTATDYSDPSNSSFEARYRDALRQGYHVGPTVDHDTHYSVFGRSTPARLVLQATALTRPALFEALQQRRFYASDDENVEVTLQVSTPQGTTQPMGSVLTQRGSPRLVVSVTDPDANDAVASIALFSGIPSSGIGATQLTTSVGSATLTYEDPIIDKATYYWPWLKVWSKSRIWS